MTYLINPFFCYCCYLPEVKSKRNSALKTPITVSSVLNNNYGDYHPYYATDGLVPNGFTKMFHSAFESFPWITVDLLDILTMFFIRFHNRVDGSGNYLYFTCILF